LARCHENSCLRRRLLERYWVAEALQAVNQISSRVVLIKTVQVEIFEVVVANLLRQRVVDRHEDLVGHGNGRPLESAARLKTIKLLSPVPAGSDMY